MDITIIEGANPICNYILMFGRVSKLKDIVLDVQNSSYNNKKVG
jgi:hypothetical protein